MADKTNLVETIDHKNPPKPLPQKAGETKPAAHPAFNGERPEVIDHKNPPKPLTAKPGGSPQVPAAAKVALILLFAWLSLLPAFAGLGVVVTNNLTVPLSVAFYTNTPALVISGLTSVGTNASATVTNSSGSWSGLILVNTNNNAAVTVAFAAGASTNT